MLAGPRIFIRGRQEGQNQRYGNGRRGYKEREISRPHTLALIMEERAMCLGMQSTSRSRKRQRNRLSSTFPRRNKA